MIKQGKDKKMLAASAVILILALVAIVVNFVPTDFFEIVWPSEENLTSETNELKKLQFKLKTKLDEAAKTKHRYQNFINRGKDFWIKERDGAVETEAQKKVEQAARTAGTNLNSLGSVRGSKLKEGIEVMEFSIGAKGSMEEISRFMAELYRTYPKFHWGRCVLKMDTGKNAEKKEVTLSGSLKFVCISEKKLIDIFINKTTERTQ
jgi:hypothetical protein